jgi:D-alanyl-D-alanine carboxypeptidase
MPVKSPICSLTALLCVFGLGFAPWSTARAEDLSPQAVEAAQKLIDAYPDFLDRVDGGMLVWKDGTQMPIDDHKPGKKPSEVLERPDLKDQFAQAYVLGKPDASPAVDWDPGRARFDPLFRKMYGDCKKGGVVDKLVAVPWLPLHHGGSVRVSPVNGLANHLEAVSEELDKLPDADMRYMIPTAGTFTCRVIAGTDRTSMHAYGAAIDLNTAHADYWRNAKADASGRLAYRNAIPFEIVDAFERHGFIWGGKWYHYDTMHFEYRPELNPSPAGDAAPPEPTSDPP